MRYTTSLVLAAILLGSSPLALAEDAKPSAAPALEAPSPPAKARELTPEEKAEKEARKACKVKICDIITTKSPVGDDVSCDIVKTWREEDITKMLSDKISWPWGKALCQSKLELKREPLAKAMSEANYEIDMPSHKVRCTLAQKEKGEPYVVEIAMAPKVKFENGKASEATLNWGETSAPMLIYPLIYAGTALDNSTNVLGREVVRMVNEFATKKCAEVRTELDHPPN